jgi:SHS2 domain-containing protein
VSHRWGEHVGELELRLEARDEPGVYAAAVRALGELMEGDDERGGAAAHREECFDVAAAGEDRAALLAAWIEELVFLAEHDGFVPVAVEDLALERGSVRARVGGYRGDPPHLVKAVTYHGLEFKPSGERWRANVVLDV